LIDRCDTFLIRVSLEGPDRRSEKTGVCRESDAVIPVNCNVNRRYRLLYGRVWGKGATKAGRGENIGEEDENIL